MPALLSEKLNKAEIARLSRDQIGGLKTNDLVEIVNECRLPFLSSEDLMRLPLMSRETLLKLAFLSRKVCRNTAGNARWSALSD